MRRHGGRTAPGRTPSAERWQLKTASPLGHAAGWKPANQKTSKPAVPHRTGPTPASTNNSAASRIRACQCALRFIDSHRVRAGRPSASCQSTQRAHDTCSARRQQQLRQRHRHQRRAGRTSFISSSRSVAPGPPRRAATRILSTTETTCGAPRCSRGEILVTLHTCTGTGLSRC